MTSRYFFPAFIMVCYLGLASSVSANDTFEIDIHRDTSLLPFHFVSVLEFGIMPNRIPLHRPVRVLRPAVGQADSGLAISIRNGKMLERESACISKLLLPSWRGDDSSLRLTVTDWSSYRDSLLQREVICGCGQWDDTAWVFRFDPETGQTKKTVLLKIDNPETSASMSASPMMHLVSDYDFDGMHEMIVYFDAGAHLSPRVLFSVKLETMEVQWSLPMASELIENCVYDCRDSLNPAIILATNVSAHGIVDEEFSDAYSYLVKINQHGNILLKRIVAAYPFRIHFVASETPGLYFLAHSLEISDPDSMKDVKPAHSHFSLIDNYGNVLKSTEIEDFAALVWRMPYDSFPAANYLFLQDDVIRVYDDSLQLVAVSNKLDKVRLPQQLLGRIMLDDRSEESFVFSNGIYTSDFKQLLALPFNISTCEVASIDSAGEVTSIVLSGPGRYTVGRIERKSIVDLLTILYVDYQKHVLIAGTALLVTLVLTNYYRRRTKRDLDVITLQKREIEWNHEELARAHKALTLAQSQIIAQEKYLQAKSIAGGFAHEIRNALFPAEGALHSLTGMLDKAGLKDTRIDLSIDAMKTATSRAIQLTEVINNYTNLDIPTSTERVSIAQIVSLVLQRNSPVIETMGVKIVIEGGEACSIAANVEHLQAVFNNLLVNALDALTNSTNPCIMISWSDESGNMRMRFADNGPGISDDVSKRIFEPFYSTKPYKGTGLGLSIVKKIVELYEGSISVSSEVGKGTAFEIELKMNGSVNFSD